MKIRFRPQLVHLRPVVAVLALLLAVSVPAWAQLTPVGGTVPTLTPTGTVGSVQETDIAYDPAHDAYLVVTAFGPVWGVFVNGNNTPVTPVFMITDGSLGFGHRPIAVYSPDVSNGAGGTGGFLVTWNAASGGGNCPNSATPCTLQDRIVSLQAPGYFVTGVQTVTDTSQGSIYFENHAAVAYSRASHIFLVAYMTSIPAYGLQARFLNTAGVPVSGTLRLSEGSTRDPGLAWNPATNDFGMVNAGWGGGSAFAQFRMINSAGVVSGTSTFGYATGTYATAIDVNASNQYVLSWALSPGVVSAAFDQVGNPLGTTFVSNRIGGDTSLDMKFNAATNTFAVVSSDFLSAQVAASELYSDGVPRIPAGIITNDPATNGSFYPRVATRAGTNQWDVITDVDFKSIENQIVISSGFFGTPPAVGSALGAPPVTPPTSSGGSTSTGGCTGSDPFAAIGGGHCVNGGWIPGPATGGSSAPTTPTPTPTPTPTSGSTCTGSDPFASIGGGHCVNGGWIPGPAPSTGGSTPTTPTPTPTPAPTSSSTCSGSDPFAAIGGGHCVNGGWVPGAAPSTSSGTCSGSDPFASVGGGVCVNGGWVPGAIAGGCTTPDPFTSIGGGTCVSGGWVPKG